MVRLNPLEWPMRGRERRISSLRAVCGVDPGHQAGLFSNVYLRVEAGYQFPQSSGGAVTALRLASFALVVAGLGGCSDATQPMPPTLIGSWSELSTGRPDLRPGIQRCFLFREVSSYVQDDILPDTTPPAPVPQGLLRWQGTISVVAGDTLERTLDFQDIYHQDADTLKPVYHDELLGSFDARMTVGSNTLDLDYTLWVQGEGFVAIHDTYSRGTAGSCGATL